MSSLSIMSKVNRTGQTILDCRAEVRWPLPPPPLPQVSGPAFWACGTHSSASSRPSRTWLGIRRGLSTILFDLSCDRVCRNAGMAIQSSPLQLGSRRRPRRDKASLRRRPCSRPPHRVVCAVVFPRPRPSCDHKAAFCSPVCTLAFVWCRPCYTQGAGGVARKHTVKGQAGRDFDALW